MLEKSGALVISGAPAVVIQACTPIFSQLNFVFAFEDAHVQMIPWLNVFPITELVACAVELGVEVLGRLILSLAMAVLRSLHEMHTNTARLHQDEETQKDNRLNHKQRFRTRVSIGFSLIHGSLSNLTAYLPPHVR